MTRWTTLDEKITLATANAVKAYANTHDQTFEEFLVAALEALNANTVDCEEGFFAGVLEALKINILEQSDEG